MTRWLPYPLLALALLAMWLLLAGSLAPGALLLGAMIALFATWAMAALRPEKMQVKAVRPLVRLGGMVLVDIIRSNIAVARIVLGLSRRDRVSGFVQMPIEMRNPYGLTMLACIITATPGTVWVQFDRNAGRLLVHVLDLVDEDEWITLIKGRYERLLMEIFA